MSNIKGNYGKSENGNFEVTDSIGVPHPYVIGPEHVAYASDNHGGMLWTTAIIEGEKLGITCKAKGCNLIYSQHEQALLVTCRADLHDAEDMKKTNPELQAYLLKIKEEAEANNYAGFAFLDKR